MESIPCFVSMQAPLVRKNKWTNEEIVQNDNKGGKKKWESRRMPEEIVAMLKELLLFTFEHNFISLIFSFVKFISNFRWIVWFDLVRF